jgi:AcrR family transcriptional regulator
MQPEPSAAVNQQVSQQPDLSGGTGLSDVDARAGAMEGALIAAGEIGYRDASVRTILDYSGGHRAQFYKDFASKDDCFAQAYEVWIERLGADLLEAAITAGGWEAGVRAALASLFEFIVARPAIARSLFVEVQVAGGPALAKREEALERLACAVDSVRDEIDPNELPPAATGDFVIGGIDACVCEVLTAGDPKRIWEAMPELMHLVVGSYFGKEAGEAASDSARAFLEERSSSGRTER